MQSLLIFIYFFMPHLEWYYLSDFVVYSMGTVPWVKILYASLYAATWTGAFLLLAWFGFRRKNLTT